MGAGPQFTLNVDRQDVKGGGKGPLENQIQGLPVKFVGSPEPKAETTKLHDVLVANCQWRWEVGPLRRSKTVPLGVIGQHKCPH